MAPGGAYSGEEASVEAGVGNDIGRQRFGGGSSGAEVVYLRGNDGLERRALGEGAQVTQSMQPGI